MVPTLEEGQRILVNRFLYSFSDPKIGDIVVFHPPVGAADSRCGVQKAQTQPCPEPIPQKADENFVKRIVAGPGDRISIKNGHPVVNGVEMTDEDYIEPCGPGGRGCDLPSEIVVPPDHYFMMGDNRGGSDDSRFWGPVPRDWFIGKAFATYWPPDRLGIF